MFRGGSLSRRLVGSLVVVLLAVLGPTAAAWAQGAGGVITGTVSDTQGGALPGATLSLRNADTGATRTTTSERDGRYRFAALAPGRYELKAELQGFASVDVTDLVLTIGLEIKHDFTLGLQGLQESLTVTAQSPVVETTRSEVSALVTQAQIETLPIEGRVAVSLALLLPGTGGDTVRPRRNNANVGAGGVAIYSTNFLVDGTTNMSTKAGEPRMDFPQSAIREFKVNVSQAPAEYGGRSSGFVTVVTKGGTNLWTGEAFEYFRDKSLNAFNRFEEELHDQRGTPKPAYRRHLYGGALGGPIVRDRLHFLVASERTDEQQKFIVNTGQPQFYSKLEGSFPYSNMSTLFFARGDVQINSHQSLFVRWARQGGTTICEGCGGTRAAAAGSDLYIPRDSFVAGHTWVLGSRALNEIRFQRAVQWHYERPHGTPEWRDVGVFSPQRFQQINPTFVFPSLTWGANNVFVHNQDIWEIRDDFSLTSHWKGAHNMKFGGAFQNLPLNEDVQGNPLGVWTFASDQVFDGTPQSIANLRTPNQFTASFPALARKMSNRYYQAYVQDDWRPRNDLTVNLGVRYDLQTDVWNEHLSQSLFPRPLPYVDFASRGDKNNVSPRLGLAWDINDNARSVLRGGYGLFAHAIIYSWVVAETTTLRQTSINIRNPTYPDPYGGRDPLSFASTAAPNIQTLDNDLRNPLAHTANIGYSQELGQNLAVHLDGVYTQTNDFVVAVNINTPDPITRVRPNPAWGRIVQNQSVGVAKYRALLVRLERRYANRYQYLASYTLSKHDNDFAGTGQTPSATDFYNRGLDHGPANNDRRHALVLSGAVLLPWDVTLGTVWTMRSSLPFSALAGTDLNQDGSNTDYVPGTSRNIGNRDNATLLAAVNAYRAASGRGPIAETQIDTNGYNRLDLRVSKSLSLGGTRKVEVIGQVFNLLGSDNLLASGGAGSWVTNASSNSFGRILQALPRQQAELALRVVW